MSLSKQEKIQIQLVNKRNEYGLSAEMLKKLNEKHKKASANGDTHTMEAVEYRLTDINFHTECGMMARGEYDKVDEIIKNFGR